jgi:hypothetical protein
VSTRLVSLRDVCVFLREFVYLMYQGVFLLLFLRVAVSRISLCAQVHQKDGTESSDQKQLGGQGLRVSKDRLYGPVARIVQKLLLRVQDP